MLIADDSETITTLLTVALSSEGYRVVAANNGVAAYELACEYEIDLAILDQLMPGLLGVEVLEKWRGEGLKFPVIMCSGVEEEATIVDCLTKGAVDFVRKPFLVSELTARVALALNR